ncbi:hypothetical protein Tco_1557566 [Tanacetum coccineum]
MDYEQVINVLAMEKLRLEEELRATKSKLKLYDRLFFIMLGSFSVVCVGFGMLIVLRYDLCAQIVRYLLKVLVANACCSSLQQSKCLLQSKANAANTNACLQMQVKMLAANATCKCKMQMQPANANAYLQMQPANARCKCKLQMQPTNATYKCKL